MVKYLSPTTPGIHFFQFFFYKNLWPFKFWTKYFFLSTLKPWTDEFKSYINGRGYNLNSVDEYETFFKQVGFKNFNAKDQTQLFIEYLNKEIQAFTYLKEDFLKVNIYVL